MGTAKICKKFNPYDGFLRADQDRAKDCRQVGWIGCPILQVAQKAGILSVLAGCKCKASLFTFCPPSQGREHVNKLALYLQPTSPDKMPGCLLFLAVNSNFLFRRVIWQLLLTMGSKSKYHLRLNHLLHKKFS